MRQTRGRALAQLSGLCGTASSDSSPEEYASGYQNNLYPTPRVNDTDRGRALGKVVVLRAAPESVALGSGTNNVSTPSVAHGAPERPAERL